MRKYDATILHKLIANSKLVTIYWLEHEMQNSQSMTKWKRNINEKL